VVVLGGGKQAHMRGGDVRRIVIHSEALHGADVMDVYHRLANDHPGIGGRAVRIQAVYRGFIMRKARDAEIKRNKEEFDRESAEDEEVKEGEPAAAVAEANKTEEETDVEAVAVDGAVAEATPAAEIVEEAAAAEEVKVEN
jgi:hypothetical protein